MEQKREIQAELFQEVGKHPEKRKEGHRSQPIGKRYGILFNLSYENIAFVIIALILVIAIVFSLGVEKGKRLAIYKNPQKTQTITADVQPKEVRPQIVKVEKKIEITEKAEQKIDSARIAPPLLPQNQNSVLKTLQPQISDKISKPYTIQVGTYTAKPNAKKQMDRLAKMGFVPFIISTNGKYEVCVGEYIDKQDAEGYMQKLKKNYKDCFLRRR